MQGTENAHLRVLLHAGEKDPQIPAEAREPRDLLAGREQTRANQRVRVLLARLRGLRVSRAVKARFHRLQQAEKAVLHALCVVVVQIGRQIGEVHRELDASAQHGGEVKLR